MNKRRKGYCRTCAEREKDCGGCAEQSERMRIERALFRAETSVSSWPTILANFFLCICLPLAVLYPLYLWWVQSGLLVVGIVFFAYALAAVGISVISIAFIVITYPTRERVRRRHAALRYWRREAERLERLVNMKREQTLSPTAQTDEPT